MEISPPQCPSFPFIPLIPKQALRVTVPQIFRRIKSKLAVPFSMEIIIIMASSIWLTRNDWIFNNVDPSVEDCRRKFK
jgi:hypothetical protein